MTQKQPPAQLFDCLQVNLAFLADRWYGPSISLRLGSTLRFGLAATADGLPTFGRSVRQHLDDAEEFLGLRFVPSADTSLSPDTAAHQGEIVAPAEQEIHYVVADAYGLPWVPYYQRQHLEHSFLLSSPTAAAATVPRSAAASGAGASAATGSATAGNPPSFSAASGAVVEDGYFNDTPWGSARPGVWNLTSGELGSV